MSHDLDECRDLLLESFARVEEQFLLGSASAEEGSFQAPCAVVFASKTQAYREVLLGCLLTRIVRPDRDIRLPYLDQGRRRSAGALSTSRSSTRF
jgi:hypothetical protein